MHLRSLGEVEKRVHGEGNPHARESDHRACHSPGGNAFVKGLVLILPGLLFFCGRGGGNPVAKLKFHRETAGCALPTDLRCQRNCYSGFTFSKGHSS